MSLLNKTLSAVAKFLTLLILFCHPAVAQDKFQSLESEIQKIVKDTKAVGVSVALIDNYEWFGQGDSAEQKQERMTV